MFCLRPLIAAACAALSLVGGAHAHAHERWAVMYGDVRDAKRLEGFDTLVLEADQKPPVAALKAQGSKVLAYVSLCEIDLRRKDYANVRSEKLLLGRNPNWPENRYVDVRKPAWQRRILDDTVPALLAQGYDGVMLDTVDSCLYLDAKNPKRYGGMAEAAVNLVKDMRARFPQATIMLNRGFDALERFAPHVDAVLAESILARYDFKTRKSAWFAQSEYDAVRAILDRGRKANPSLKVYTLDYWPFKDREGLDTIYRTQRANGYVPYVASIDLRTLGPRL